MRSRRSARLLGRGFTLIEMMVVVAIIAMMAALAAPSVMSLIRDNRSQRDALSLLVMVQDAHSRAFGRGAAVILQYTEGAAPGAIDVIDFREQLRDIDADGTADLPLAQCSGGMSSGPIRYWQTSDRDKPTDVTMNLNGQGGIGQIPASGVQQLCFLPRGGTRALVPNTALPPIPPNIWQNMTDVVQFAFRSDATSSGAFTKQRFVLLYPNGNSRFR